MSREARTDAVIFDMDGLLIDSEPVWADAETIFLARKGKSYDREVAKQYFGMRVEDAIEIMKREYAFEGRTADLTEEWVSEFLHLCHERLPLRPGADEAVSELHKTHKLAIASSSPRVIIERVVSLFGWRQYMSEILSGEEVEHGKPAPDLFLLTATKLGVSPGRCVVLEDSVAGVRAAKAAGMVCFAVPSREVFVQEEFGEADAVFDSLIAAKEAILRYGQGV